MKEKKSFLEELIQLTKLRLWIVPWAMSVIFAYAGVKTMASYGADPMLVALTLFGTVGALLLPMIPTRRDLLGHFRLAVEAIDKRFAEKKLTQDQAEATLALASTYAHTRNVVVWPLWWLSERGQLRRLIAAHAK